MSDRIPFLFIGSGERDASSLGGVLYANGSEKLDLVGVVTSHGDPGVEAILLDSMFSKLGIDVPIAVGSAYGLAHDERRLSDFRHEALINEEIAEMLGRKRFISGQELINEKVSEYGSNLVIGINAPPTELARAVLGNTDAFKDVSVYVQGHAEQVGAGFKKPLQAAHPSHAWDKDMDATTRLFGHQHVLKLSFIGRHFAYPLMLTEDDFSRFEGQKDTIGNYFSHQAKEGLNNFRSENPKACNDLYAHSEMSIPYGAAVGYAVAAEKDDINPIPSTDGRHKMFGMLPDSSGHHEGKSIIAKSDIADTIYAGLKPISLMSYEK